MIKKKPTRCNFFVQYPVLTATPLTVKVGLPTNCCPIAVAMFETRSILADATNGNWERKCS